MKTVSYTHLDVYKRQEVDWGFDYYAPQTLEDEDGRRIMFGWAGGWDWMPWWNGHGPSEKEEWCGFFGIPREVRLLDDHSLQFIPVKELESLRRREMISVSEESITEETPVSYTHLDVYKRQIITQMYLRQTAGRNRRPLMNC